MVLPFVVFKHPSGQEVYSTNSDNATQDVVVVFVLGFLQGSQSIFGCCFPSLTELLDIQLPCLSVHLMIIISETVCVL